MEAVGRERGTGAGRRGRSLRVAAGAAVAAALVAGAACGSSPGTTSSAPSASSTAPARTDGTAGSLAAPASPGPEGTATDGVGPSSTDTTGAPPASNAPPTSVGASPYPIGTLDLALVDTTRPTVSRGVTISSSRSLPTAVAYPTDAAGPRPLLVFAHGFRLGPPGYTRMIATLVAAGYVVAAPSFPLADEAVAGARVDRGDLPNQPGDLSFVIDQVLAEATRPGSHLAGRVDGSRVGAVGHSDGADTVLDLGYTGGRADGRVRAVVALSPDAVVGAGSGVGASTPLLLEHGDADDVVPYSESVSVFANVPAHRYFLTLLGAGHLQPVTDATAWTLVLDATVVAFLDRYVAGEPLDDAAITRSAKAAPNARIEVAG